MRSGDIEMNSGPETQQQPDDTPARQTRQATLTNHGQPVQNQNVSLNDIMIELKMIRADMIAGTTRMEDKLKTVTDDVSNLREENRELREQLKTVRDESVSLITQIDSMESQSRKNNVVVRGIKEEQGETWEKCEKALRETLVDKVEMRPEDAGAISIECAHRLPGRRREEGKLSFYKARESILQMARKKKPAGIFFMEDCTKAVRENLFPLKDKLKKARDLGYRASLTHDKLVITNAEGKRNIYTYDAVTKNITCVSSNFAERE